MLGIIYGILLMVLVLDAVGDAFRTNRHYTLHHIAESVNVGLSISLLFIGYISSGKNIEIGQYIIHSKDYVNFAHLLCAVGFYVTSRFVFFDLIYNLVTKQPLGYIGTKGSSIYVDIFYWIARNDESNLGFVVTLLKGFGFIFWTFFVYVLINWFII